MRVWWYPLHASWKGDLHLLLPMDPWRNHNLSTAFDLLSVCCWEQSSWSLPCDRICSVCQLFQRLFCHLSCNKVVMNTSEHEWEAEKGILGSMQLIIKILESSSSEVSKEKYNESKQTKKLHLILESTKGGCSACKAFSFKSPYHQDSFQFKMTNKKPKRILCPFWGRDKALVLTPGTFELCPTLSTSTVLYLTAVLWYFQGINLTGWKTARCIFE